MNTPLRFELTEAEHAALPDTMMGLYQRSGDTFRLSVDGLDDGALTRALRGEREARREDKREAAATVAEANKAAEEARAELERERKANENLRARTFDALLKTACSTHRLHAAAYGDCQRAARELFELAGDGTLRPRDGKTTFETWMASIATHSPHWLPAASGSGATQSEPPRESYSRTITRARYEQLSPSRRAAVIASGTTILDH